MDAPTVVAALVVEAPANSTDLVAAAAAHDSAAEVLCGANPKGRWGLLRARVNATIISNVFVHTLLEGKED